MVGRATFTIVMKYVATSSANAFHRRPSGGGGLAARRPARPAVRGPGVARWPVRYLGRSSCFLLLDVQPKVAGFCGELQPSVAH